MVGSFLPPKGKIFILLAKPVVEAVSSSTWVEAGDDFGDFGRKWLCCRKSSALQGHHCSRCAAKVPWLWFDSWSQSRAVKSDSAHTWLWLGVKSWVVPAQRVQSGGKNEIWLFWKGLILFSRVDSAWSVQWKAQSWGPNLLLLDRTQNLPNQVYEGGRREP